MELYLSSFKAELILNYSNFEGLPQSDPIVIIDQLMEEVERNIFHKVVKSEEVFPKVLPVPNFSTKQDCLDTDKDAPKSSLSILFLFWVRKVVKLGILIHFHKSLLFLLQILYIFHY